MASIQARRRGKRTYYYLVESRRVNGKPRPVVLKYLGTAETLQASLEAADREKAPVRAEVLSFGAVAALWDLVERLDIVGTIDRHLPKSPNGVGSGKYLALAAVNRCIASTSKAGFPEWYRKTVLPRLCRVSARLLTGQRFWDAMDVVSPEVIRSVEMEISARLVRDFNLDLRVLCFDCTNFDTFFDSTNPAALAQRGHAKSKRTDLRIMGLALMVTMDAQIPLFSQIYPGNQPDSVTFESITDDLVARYHLLAKEAEHVTVVFDKGNNSKENLEEAAGAPYHVVGSLVPSHHPDLINVPLKNFVSLDDPHLENVLAYRIKKKVWGREWTIIVTRSENLLQGQLRGIAQHLAKRRKSLRALQMKLRRSQMLGAKGKGYTRESLEKHARELAQGQYLKEILKIEVSKKRRRLTLSFHTDAAALQRLANTVLGKTIIFTDNHDWSTEEIVVGYRSQHHVEAAFRQMKDPFFVSFSPVRHWTDQKVRVHAFYCVLALTLAHLLRREMARQGITLSTDALLTELDAIQEIVNLYPTTGATGGRPSARRILASRTPLQERLFSTLNLGRFERG